MSNQAQASGENPEVNFDRMGYDLIEEYVNQKVKVFMSSGAVLSGEVTRTRGKYFLVKHPLFGEALVNLDHVASVTRM